MQRTEIFAPGDRYQLDFGACSMDKGWAQFDTESDASYFGNWVNPKELKIVSYAEGDLTTLTAETPEEFAAEVRRMVDWYNERGRFKGIDCGIAAIRNKMEAALQEMGLEDLLYQPKYGDGSKPCAKIAR